MAQRRGARVRTVVGGVPVLVGLLAITGPVLAETAPDATTTTTVPPIETKIILIEPATPPAAPPPRAPAAAPAPSVAAPARARTAPSPPAATTAAAVPADSPALRALVEAAAAERRRLEAEIAGAEARVVDLEGAVAAAQVAREAEDLRLQSVEMRLAGARAELDAAAGQVARTELSAAAATEVVQARRTRVARPPAPGRTPEDAAVQARQALTSAMDRRLASGRALAELETELEAARESTEGASSELLARIDALQAARDVLTGLREQLATAENSAPAAVADRSRPLVLVPQPGPVATTTIPADWLSLYGRAAATCPGLPWTVLAAVGAVESGHGQSTLPGVRSGANYAGAMGPMQFIAGTWAGYGVDGDGDGVRDVYNPTDAVFGAARYLCASGGGSLSTLRRALWAYNHADWYVEMVLAQAARY